MTDNTAVLFISKLLPLFVYPLGLAIVLITLGSAFNRLAWRRLTSACIIGATAVLWLASTPVLSEWALSSLERQYPPRELADLPQAEVAIVLGGAVGRAVPPRTTLDLMGSSDRVLHAARLYKAGKVQRVLVTAGNVPWQSGETPEAFLIRDLLVEWDVPLSAIDIAGASRNTYENALEVISLRQNKPFASGLLVTSAAHMPRAMAVFKKVGLPVTAATTDVEVVAAGPWTPLRWLPDAAALYMTTIAMKEWMGLWVYRARGYL